MSSQEPTIYSSFEVVTGTWQYVVADDASKKAVIIDSVLDYDPSTREISTKTADGLIDAVRERGYHIEKILETHAHADHLTAASYIQHRLYALQGNKPPICIGKRIEQVQEVFAARFGIPVDEYKDAFDHLFDDDEVFPIGDLQVQVIHLPGHTPDHIGYKIGDNVFCGDSIFHADIGTARTDFPGGSAESLYASATKLLNLPGHFKVWTGHDYPACPTRCEPVPWLTVREHQERNRHVSHTISRDEFLNLRKTRDMGLKEPRLLQPSLQINIRAGRLPTPNPAGVRLLHLELDVPSGDWPAPTA